MIKFSQLTFLAILFFALFGCGGGSDNTDNSNTSLSADEILSELTFQLKGNEGSFIEGDVPFDNTSIFPSIISSPDVVETNISSTERIELVFGTEAIIEEVYLTVAGASGYYSFTKNDGAQNADTESVSISVGVPSAIQDNSFCMNISVKDSNQSLSRKVEICFSVSDENEANRVIYFADFSSNSTLSTLNFDTGQVTNIGPTGYQLTDIAFLGDELYGVSFTDLIKINLETGVGTLVGNIGSSGVNALEGDADILYAGTTAGEFLTINPITGYGTPIGYFGSGASSSGDFVFDGNMELIFASLIVPGSLTDELALIHPENGLTSFVGETGFSQVYGLAFFRNQLLGLTSNGELIIIDTSTGVGTLVNNTQAFSAGGAAAVRNKVTSTNSFPSSVAVDNFVADKEGVCTDMDGVYGCQCVDLMHSYIEEVLVVPRSDHNIRGNAYPIYAGLGASTTISSGTRRVRLDKIDNTPAGIPQKGDIIFWTHSDGIGHVGIFLSGDVNSFQSLDQNWVDASATNGSAAARVNHTYTGSYSVAGWLRPVLLAN